MTCCQEVHFRRDRLDSGTSGAPADCCPRQFARAVSLRPVSCPPCATINAMSTSVRLECSGPSIRAVLAELAPEDLVDFEAEFRCALAEADEDFDLTRVHAVLRKWWGRAHLRVHPPTADEHAAVARVAAGDDTGLHTRTTTGRWVEL